MSYGSGTLSAGDFDHSLGDERAGNAGAEEVLALVNRACLKHGENEVPSKLLLEVVHIALFSPGF